MVFIPYGEGIEMLQFYFLFFADNDSRRLPMEVYWSHPNSDKWGTTPIS